MNASSLRRIGQMLLIPILAVFTALVVGALVMWVSGDNPFAAYRGLWNGAFGNARNWSETIRKMTPLILTGLSVAVAFKAGLFNIGASGQFIIGTVCSVAVGVNFGGLPAFIHLPLAMLAGIAGGMLWGFIPGALKVFTGAHEVIVTIMLNYVASLFAGWTVYAGGTQGQTPGPLWDTTAWRDLGNPDVFVSARCRGFLATRTAYTGASCGAAGGAADVVDHFQDDAGLCHAHSGCKQQGRTVRWHQRQLDHHSHDDDRRWAGGSGGYDRDAGAQSQICPRVYRRRRLRRHHRGAAGADQPNRCGAFGFLAGRIGRGRLRDAVRFRRSCRHHPDHPGAGAGLRGRANDHSPLYRIRKPSDQIESTVFSSGWGR
jgi:hypothetical protein